MILGSKGVLLLSSLVPGQFIATSANLNPETWPVKSSFGKYKLAGYLSEYLGNELVCIAWVCRVTNISEQMGVFVIAEILKRLLSEKITWNLPISH